MIGNIVIGKSLYITVTGTEMSRASSADDILSSRPRKTPNAKGSQTSLSQQADKVTPALRQTSHSSGLSKLSDRRSPVGRGSPKRTGSPSSASLTPSSSRSRSPAASISRKLVAAETRTSAKHC